MSILPCDACIDINAADVASQDSVLCVCVCVCVCVCICLVPRSFLCADVPFFTLVTSVFRCDDWYLINSADWVLWCFQHVDADWVAQGNSLCVYLPKGRQNPFVWCLCLFFVCDCCLWPCTSIYLPVCLRLTGPVIILSTLLHVCLLPDSHEPILLSQKTIVKWYQPFKMNVFFIVLLSVACLHAPSSVMACAAGYLPWANHSQGQPPLWLMFLRGEGLKKIKISAG